MAAPSPDQDLVGDSTARDELAAWSRGEYPTRSMTAYGHLLRESGVALPDVAAALSVPEATASGIVRDLEAEGLVLPSLSVPGAWRAVAPEIALYRMLREAEAELDERRAQTDRMRQQVEAFVADHRREREERLTRQVEVLTTIDAIVTTVEALNNEATTEMLSFATDRPSRQEASAARPHDQDALARGISMRMLRLEGHVGADFIRDARWFVEQGAQMRLATTLPGQMIIWDRSVAVLPIDPAMPNAGAAIVRTPGLVASLVALFEAYWEIARNPFVDQEERDPDALTELEQAVLRLLSNGMTDESVARHLDISARSARRITAGLASRVKARSRFELALKARDRGWI